MYVIIIVIIIFFIIYFSYFSCFKFFLVVFFYFLIIKFIFVLLLLFRMDSEMFDLEKQLKVAKASARKRFLSVYDNRIFWGPGSGPLDLDLGNIVHRDFRLKEYVGIFKKAGEEKTREYVNNLGFFGRMLHFEKVRAAKLFLSGDLEKLAENYDPLKTSMSY